MVYMGQSLRPGPPWKRVDAERFWKHQVLNESNGFKDDFGVLASPELFLALVRGPRDDALSRGDRGDAAAATRTFHGR